MGKQTQPPWPQPSTKSLFILLRDPALSLSLSLESTFFSPALQFVPSMEDDAASSESSRTKSPTDHTRTHSHIHSHPETQLHHKFFNSNSFLLIIIPITIFLFLFATTLAILLLRRLKSTKKSAICKENGGIHHSISRLIAHTTINVNSSPDVIEGGCLNKGSQGRTPQSRLKGVQVFTYRELEAATEKFNERNVIWREGKGEMYRGVLGDGTVAAIKALHREGKHRERGFRMEVDLLSRLQSPCLVELLGYCADQNHRLLVFEFMQNGTLQGSLHHHNTISQPLDWGTRLRIALDCAKALEFLHEHAVPTVIHRDFKCSNVFLDQNFRAKVSGFGSAKMGSDKINSQMSTNMLGTSGYLAPEYASTGKLTTKSDVYSYGVVLLELLTGRMPVDINRPPGQHVLVSWALPRLTNREKLMEMVDPSIQGQFSKKDLIQIAAIAAMCVQPEADYRPLMTDVVQSLIPLVKNPSSMAASMASSGSSRFFIHTPSPK